MKFSFPNANVYRAGKFEKINYITNELSLFNSFGSGVSAGKLKAFNNNCFVFPAFCDVHVHLREPGFFYKETIKTGTMAAAHGGYSDVFAMPNLNPVPDSQENILREIEIIKRDAVVNVHPYSAITVGENGNDIADLNALSQYAVAFSDDGRGVQNEEIMLEAMKTAKALNKTIAAHCEDNLLLCGGYINEGRYAQLHGHSGICAKSEWGPIKRDIELARKTGCKYHVCHISTKESVELIRHAKADGVNITCETAPHYLLLNDMQLQDDGRFKMNPPIRSEDDRQALLAGIADGTIDVIATDHAPHSKQEKSGGLKNSLMGVTGLETAFPVLYTYLVKPGIISLDKLIELMSINPRKIFGLPETQNICVFDLEESYLINPESFLSKGKSTPFEGLKVFGQNKLTTNGGNAVWQQILLKK